MKYEILGCLFSSFITIKSVYRADTVDPPLGCVCDSLGEKQIPLTHHVGAGMVETPRRERHPEKMDPAVEKFFEKFSH